MNKWHSRFIDLAKLIAGWSKDPSTQVGAVIVDNRNRVIGMGYNGFPRGVKDTVERYENKEQKYPRVVHAEVNAILNAVRNVEGCSLYIFPYPPCTECTKVIIQSGISRVIVDFHGVKSASQRWLDEYAISKEMMREAGVQVVIRHE